MKKITPPYQSPECLLTDLLSESILCNSVDEDGSTIDNYDWITGDWK